MAARRTKSISTKVNEPEYERLVARAGDRTVSEWVRTVVLEAAQPLQTKSLLFVVLTELVALRMILLNLQFAVSRGEPVTADFMQGLIACADRDKFAQANARIAFEKTRREP
jgi:hypothetical protein